MDLGLFASDLADHRATKKVEIFDNGHNNNVVRATPYLSDTLF